ncbi:MAG: sortase [Saprospiraceae bacterium]
MYTGTDMMLKIPTLEIDMPIVGVSQSGNSWDVTWLGNNAGYLSGSAFPTKQGNTVITGHVWSSLNQPGPFANLKTLNYGDKIQIEAWNQTYVYEVRENTTVNVNNIDVVMKSEEYDWVTLVTCEGYNSITGNYQQRRIVRAVLIEIR